jgi:hypothetical protein
VLERIRRMLFGKSKPPKAREFAHPELGTLRLNDDGEWWEVEVTKDGEHVGFAIGGEQIPDPGLIQHALDILRDYQGFRKMVADFLESEARGFRRYEEAVQEIGQLAIEDVMLFWPERPNDGMIYFRGGDKGRLWRCDYVGRRPKGLGFDD